MRPIHSTLAALALTGLTSLASAQVHVFTVDQPASAFTWSVTTSLGNLVGTPNNMFNLSGTMNLDLGGTNPIGSVEFLSSDVLVVPDLSGFVPNILPILPPLATVDVTNLRLSASSPSTPVAMDAFTADITLTTLSGMISAVPLTGAPSMTDLTGLVSLPTPTSGTLVRAGSTITLNMPLNSVFPISITTLTPPVTGTITLNGTLVATATAIDTVGTDFCNGDGGDQAGCTDCPCMNNAAPGTIGGCLNSAGTSSRITASGDPSASLPSGSTTDLRFTMSGGPPMATSVMLSGAAVAPQSMANPCFGLNSGALSPDRDGLRCAVQSVLRHGNRSTNAMGDILDSAGPNRVWGGEAQPVDGLAGQSGFVSGQTRFFQVTHRDDVSLGCMRGLNTSQAVGVTFTP